MSRARFPLALKPDPARQASEPAPSMFAPGTGRSTPGMVRVRLTKLRPLRGRASIWRSAIVAPSSELLDWMSGVSAWMVTASVICPISSLRSRRTFWSTPTWTLARVIFLKPLTSPETV